VHTSAKARLTSAAIWRISTNECPLTTLHRLIPIVTNPENNPCIQTVIGVATNICSLAHCQLSLKISCKSVWKFSRKVANSQTDRQKHTDNDDCISSLAEVIRSKTRMWANAQRDGRPAEYRWRRLFNAAKFG